MKKYFGIAGICLVFFLLGIPLLNEMVIYTPDSARYLVWANSLAKLEGFKDNTTPEPTRYVIHAPLYPILLAPSALIFPYNVPAAKAVTLLLGWCAIFFFYIWLRKRLGEWQALLGSGLLALNPLMIVYSTQMLSDVPFALSLILVFFLAEQIVKSETVNPKLKIFFLVTVVSGIFLREVGIILMVSVVVFLLWKRQLKFAFQILVISLLLYGFWFLRNEIIIAVAENTPLRNSQVFFDHLYTSEQENIFAEFTARVWSNLAAYKGLIGRLLFTPDVSSEQTMMISISPVSVQIVRHIFQAAQIILSGITLLIAALGVWYSRKNKLLPLQFLFLGFYIPIILLYPINDVRFLFPILILIIFFFVGGIDALINWWKSKHSYKIVRNSIAGFISLALLPNIFWLQSFVTDGYRFSRRDNNLEQGIETGRQLPDIYSKPLHLAGRWIVQNSDSSTVVLTRWKELAIWLDGRKVVVSNPQIFPKAFYRQLRDYDVKFIVSVKWRSPIHEFEELFIRIPQYEYSCVYKIESVEVYSVKRKYIVTENNVLNIEDTIRTSFDNALLQIEKNPVQSENILKQILYKSELPTAVQFHISVAKEMSGQLDTAEIMFQNFLSLPQAGSYIPLVRYHLGIINLLRKKESVSTSERTRIFQTIALNYWELGYRRQAIKMLDRALASDSNNILAIVCSILFPLQSNEMASVRSNVHRAMVNGVQDINVRGAETILKYNDTLITVSNPSQRVRLKFGIVQTYLKMGLREDAIDQLHEILILNPDDEDVLFMLGELLEAKRRYAPALQCYNKIIKKNSENFQAAQKILSIKNRF